MKRRIARIQIIGELKGYGFLTPIVKRTKEPVWLKDSFVNRFF